MTQVVREEVVQRNGRSFRVVDTPGLGGVEGQTETIIKQMASTVKDSNFVLLYCLPVKPSDTLTETDKFIVKTVQSSLGRFVWDKCVLLLTFSDIARHEEFGSDHQISNYISYLQGHILAFHSILKHCGADVPEIKSILEYDRQQSEPIQESLGQIVAVPVMKSKSSTGPAIHPGISTGWTEQALDEITKAAWMRRRSIQEIPGGCCLAIKRLTKSTCEFLKNPRPHLDTVKVAVHRCFRDPRQSTALAVQNGVQNPRRVAAGALLGAGMGCLCGVCGGLWMLLGSFIGAVIAVVLGLLSFIARKEN